MMGVAIGMGVGTPSPRAAFEAGRAEELLRGRQGLALA